MNKQELKIVLDAHQKWLVDSNEGKRADLQGADLRWADLQGADLRWADLQGADLQGADLRGADLRGADLQGANLRRADLQWADLDFSCWPLWCGSKNVKVDKKTALQLIAHLCVLVCDDEEVKVAIKQLLPLARQSHRAKELGLVEDEVQKQ